MRKLVIDKIISNWNAGYDEGLQEACFKLDGWHCTQDHDPTGRQPTMFAVKLIGYDIYIVETGQANKDLEIILHFMDDEMLLFFLERQSCQKYR